MRKPGVTGGLAPPQENIHRALERRQWGGCRAHLLLLLSKCSADLFCRSAAFPARQRSPIQFTIAAEKPRTYKTGPRYTRFQWHPYQPPRRMFITLDRNSSVQSPATGHRFSKCLRSRSSLRRADWGGSPVVPPPPSRLPEVSADFVSLRVQVRIDCVGDHAQMHVQTNIVCRSAHPDITAIGGSRGGPPQPQVVTLHEGVQHLFERQVLRVAIKVEL